MNVSIAPIALAAEAIHRGEIEGYEADLRVGVAERDGVLAALEHATPVSEDYFYSLTGRFETLQNVLDIVAALRHRRDAEKQAKRKGKGKGKGKGSGDVPLN